MIASALPAAAGGHQLLAEIFVVWGAALLPVILASLIAVFRRLGNNHTRTRDDLADLRHQVARIAVHVGLEERDDYDVVVTDIAPHAHHHPAHRARTV